jgi:hypothetical protein
VAFRSPLYKVIVSEEMLSGFEGKRMILLIILGIPEMT